MRRLASLSICLLLGCAAESGEDAGGGAGGQGVAGQPQWPTGGAGGVEATGGSAGAAGSAGSAGSTAGGGSAGAAGQGGAPSSGGSDAGGLPVCSCFVQSAWCGAGVAVEAKKKGCSVPLLPAHANDLLGCNGGEWVVKQDCAQGCTAMPAGTPDACALPVCDCFVEVAWCGSGAAKAAAKKGCTIPLLPAHAGDLLYCPGGKWTVKQACSQGCIEAPAGTADSCKSSSGTGDQNPVPGYSITTPFGKPGSWAAGYHTGDDYAAPTGTKVVATRGGVVKSSGWSGWGSAYGLHVVIETNGVRHGYAHLSASKVSAGQTVAQGQQIGNVGSTGNSTGPHLHYEERVSPFGYSNHRNPEFNK